MPSGIVLVGDIMLSRGVPSHLAEITDSLASLQQGLAGTIWAGNLESPICTARPVTRDGFGGAPSQCTALVRRFDVLSVANNHALDCGPQGFEETVAFLRACGVGVIGYRSSGGVQEGVVTEVNGRRVGLLGFVVPELLPPGVPASLATTADLDLVRTEVAAMCARADGVICFLHGGAEMTRFPLSEEKSLPRQLVAMGCNVVVRGHAHVVQGAEYYGDGLILYGLGDFIFDSAVRRRRVGALVSLGGDPLGAEMQPLLVHRDRQLRMTGAPSGSALPPVPSAMLGLRRRIDRTQYYVERSISLLHEQGLQGMGYIFRRVWQAVRGPGSRRGVS